MMRTMWKTLLVTLLSFSHHPAWAQQAFKCGEYEISGVVRKSEEHLVVKLYEGTMSETVLSLPSDLEEAAQVFEDSSVTLRAKLLAPIKNQRGQVKSMLSDDEVKKLLAEDQPYSARFLREDFQERVPDPLRPEKDSGMKLVKQMQCL